MPDRFRRVRLRAQFDTHSPNEDVLKLPFLRKRSRILEIVSAHGVVFALTHSGVCAAFDERTLRRLCILNIRDDEVIRSLFYNRSNASLVTVSVHRADNFGSLRCRSTPITYFQRGMPDAGFELFVTESLKWPGFVEFDDVNCKVLTYSATNRVYKVWDLVNYSLQYSISDKGIQETKISPGIMLLIYNRSASGTHVPLKVVSIENGKVLMSFNHMLARHKKIEFIEQFNEHLLVKQEDNDLRIVDVRDMSCLTVPRTRFVKPSAFIFLYENQLFLTFKGPEVSVWNFRGERVTEFKDHTLWHQDCNTNNIYITRSQEHIVSFCRGKASAAAAAIEDEVGAAGGAGAEGRMGSVHVSNILTGECLAKVPVFDPADGFGGAAAAAGSVQVPHPVTEVTSLYFNEAASEVYTGSASGHVHVWSN